MCGTGVETTWISVLIYDNNTRTLIICQFKKKSSIPSSFKGVFSRKGWATVHKRTLILCYSTNVAIHWSRWVSITNIDMIRTVNTHIKETVIFCFRLMCFWYMECVVRNQPGEVVKIVSGNVVQYVLKICINQWMIDSDRSNYHIKHLLIKLLYNE